MDVNFCRDVCTEYLQRKKSFLGRFGRFVEVDEAVLVKIKYNRGRSVRENGVFK